MSALLTIKNLNINIGDAMPVRDVSLCVSPGRILGVTGESGSGKSMTAFAVMGLLPEGAVLGGEMMFDGKNHHPLDDVMMAECRSRKIGFIFQEPMTALNPLMTIGNQVAELFCHHHGLNGKAARAEARHILDRVGMEAIPLNRYPHQISGGQRQRVAIAMAIALKPKLLLADEPTTALDTTTQRDILSLIVRLVKEDGMGMMFITHDLALMARYADDILVMKEGGVTTTGPIDVLLNPHDEMLKNLIDASLLPSQEKKIQVINPVLSLEHIVKSYHRKTLFAAPAKPHIDDVSFTLNRGEMTGLVGRSGCGKSSLAKIALALTKADDGHVIFNQDVISPNKISKTLRPRLSAVFQDPFGSFNPKMTIADLVAEPLWGEKPSRHLPPINTRVKETLDVVEIPLTYMDRYISQCSGGERQRIAFARAMITKPDVIVLDEPVSALDAPHRGHVMREISWLSHEHNIATLFISHDLSVVRAFCPHVMVMAEGRIVEAGETAQIFAMPRHPETRRLINAMPDLGQALIDMKVNKTA